MKQDTRPQDHPQSPQDRAENQMDTHTPSHWEHEKRDVKSEAEIRANALPSDGVAGPLEQPSWQAHEVRAQQPEKLTGLQLEEPADHAAGIPGIYRAVKQLAHDHALLRGGRALTLLNQKHGIDCMSCAWPEPDGDRRMAEFCENGAKAVAWETDSRKADPEFFARHSVAELSEQSEYWLGQQGRLTHPMVLEEGATHYRPLLWDEAFNLIAQELNALSSPDEAIFYTSGRASNEAAFLYQLFVRQFGTNNLPDCSNMCHESSGSALTESIGIGKGTVTINDFAKAQVVLIIGQNPGTNHPRMLTTLEEGKHAGAKIVCINPLIEPGLLRFKDPQRVSGVLGNGTPLADMYLQVRVNGDMALLKGIMKEMLAIEDAQAGSAVDWNFVREKTHGFEEFVAALRQQDFEPLVKQSGISREQMRAAAQLLAASDRIIACWAMGLTQTLKAVPTIQEVVNLLLMRGSIGKPGAGACPVRGHSNVQGDRTMGIWERPRKEFLDQLQRTFNFEPPRHHGYDTVESIKAMHAGKAKIFIALAGNFLSATPDTEYTGEALRNTRLSVQISTKLNRSHLVTGKKALILPCLGRTETDVQKSGAQFVTTENSMGVVEISKGVLKPASEHLRSEPAIICGIASATLRGRNNLDWLALADDYDRIRELIAKVIPGCDNYNQKVRQPSGFYLPNLPREGRFDNTGTGKANFTVQQLPDHTLRDGELVMTTVRTHDQFNTTIYGLDDVYRGIRSERRVIFMNADDMKARGLNDRDVVDITSHFKGQRRRASRFIAVPYNIPRGNCATYFPEANVLVPIGSTTEKSNQATSKYVVVTVERSAQA